MQNANGKTLCELCFSPSETPLCPNCARAKRPLYYGSIPPGTTLAERYVSGMLLSRDSISSDYLCYDTKSDIRVIITEYFPTQMAHRDSGSIAVKYHSNKSDRLYTDSFNAFRAESEALVGLGRNKYLADVIMSFRENNTAYRVTRFYGTRTLEKYMKQINDRLSSSLAVTAACQVAFGLYTIHGAGIVHGDLCPANIIICGDGTVKLKGVSGISRSCVAKSGSFAELIRPGYTPSELYKNGACLTVSSDYYALGALLYYMLTGKELDDSITRLEKGGVDSPVENVSAEVLLILGRLLSFSQKDRESGFFALLNMAEEYGVTPTSAPCDPSASKVHTPPVEREPVPEVKSDSDAGFVESSPFTERIPHIDEEEPEKEKKSPHKKTAAILVTLLLVFAAAAAGVTIGYLKLSGENKPVNNPVNITVATDNTTVAEITTVHAVTNEPTRAVTTSEETTDETTAEATSSVTTTAVRTTAERTTVERTTAQTTTQPATQPPTTVPSTTQEQTVAYVQTDDYQTGNYSVVSSVRIRTSPENDPSNNNVVYLVPTGEKVEVQSVYDTGAGNGSNRYWGYIKYQGSSYYYLGYVPMSTLSIIT